MDLLKNKRLLIILSAIILALVELSGCLYSFQTTSSGRSTDKISNQSADQAPNQPPKEAPEQSSLRMPGCTCHSKRPGMVRMHNALDGEDCGQCHKENENLMSPGRPASKSVDLEKRIKSEPTCKRCHLKDGRIVNNGIKTSKTKISGALFCPKCKKQVNINDKKCGDCGGTISKGKSGWRCSVCGQLVDVDKIAALSKDKPSNDVCKICHYDKKELIFKHSQIDAYNKSTEKVTGGLNNCLACHKSHDQCGGCHF